MSEFAIKVEVSASSRESAIRQFEEEIAWLKKNDYAETGTIPRNGSLGGTGGTYVHHLTEVKGPPEPPLSSAELRKLRAIIPNIS